MAKHEEYLWRDPFGSSVSGAVLLSDHIHFLADEVGLVDPFKEQYLRPAAYDVRVGDSYYVDDVRKHITDDPIEIPPNGLVYVKTMESFNIPYYLVARYSLRVHHVYRGLLIDNGLHIDPGYCGHIWIPVHNFTTQPRTLMQGQEFISVEFNRTTSLPPYVSDIKNQDELVLLGVRGQLTDSRGYALKVFYRDLERYQRRKEDFTPRLFWDKFPGESHKSATLDIGQQLGKLKDEVDAKVSAFNSEFERRLDSLRNVGSLAFLALVVALVVAVLGVLLPILYSEFGENRGLTERQGDEIKVLRGQLEEQKRRLDAIVAHQPPSGQPPATSPATRRARP